MSREHLCRLVGWNLNISLGRIITATDLSFFGNLNRFNSDQNLGNTNMEEKGNITEKNYALTHWERGEKLGKAQDNMDKGRVEVMIFH